MPVLLHRRRWDRKKNLQKNIDLGNTPSIADPFDKYVGLDGAVIGRDGFGASAPFKEIFQQFGFTVENVYATAKKLVAGTPWLSLEDSGAIA